MGALGGACRSSPLRTSSLHVPAGPGRGVRSTSSAAASPGRRSSRESTFAATWRTSATSARSSSIRRARHHQQLGDDQLDAAGVPADLVGSVSGWRTSTTSCGTSTAPSIERPVEATGRTETETWASPSAHERLAILRATRTVAVTGVSPNARSAQQLRGDLPAGQHRLRRLLRQPEGQRDPRPRGVPVVASAAGHAGPRRCVSAVSTTCRPCSTT